MGKELPVIPSPQQSETEEKEELIYSRVFCTRVKTVLPYDSF